MIDYLKEYWDNQAELFKTSHKASWGDNFVIDLEIATIGKYISAGNHVLDVGCANGHSCFLQLEQHSDVSSIKGVDFSERMISYANSAKANKGLGDIVSFDVGDIGSLNFPDSVFDLVYTTRVVINLPTWEDQQLAISECLRVTRPGGKVILSEGFWEPFMLLNAMRLLNQLPPLVEHDFNRYLKKSVLEDFLRRHDLSFVVEDFSSIYYLGSRFLRELVTDASAYPEFTNPINRIFHDIEKDYSGGGFGIQQAYVITKGCTKIP